MKKTFNSIFNDAIINLGLIAIATSFITFLVTCRNEITERPYDFNIFFVNYVITIAYTVIILATAFSRFRWKISKSKIEYTLLALVLWLISAFSLNRELNVFEDSVNWLSALVTLSCLALILLLFNKKLPGIVKHILFFVLGIAFILFSYYMLYLSSLYAVGILAAIGLGISLHAFVPLSLLIYATIFCGRLVKDQRKLLYTFIAGSLLAASICFGFIAYWGKLNRQITIIANKNTLNEKALPAWVEISQAIPSNFVGERLMKADLVYKTVDINKNWLFDSPSNNAFNEHKQHDPLVVMAALCSGKPKLEEDQRIKILKAMFNSRHQAQERLWSGDKLSTANVISNVRVFPEFRMAYTEKTLNIHNASTSKWDQEEAIYTFHLPEGAVVSSLSLWINGKEEKGRLTTKSKADSAYKQIVGIEQKDPSVVHWQEGNTVSVRVFPCTSEEERKFKIGITSPLHKKGNQLIYENIYFDGPTSSNASETVQLSFSQKPVDLQLNKSYEEAGNNTYILTDEYNPSWQLSCAASALSTANFSFGEAAYTLKARSVHYQSFTPETVYLDLNNSWTTAEFKAVWEAVKLKKVFVFDDHLTPLNETNKDELFTKLTKLNFSLFPFYKIAAPKRALVISKSSFSSSNLDDLKESEFGKKLIIYLDTNKGINFYNIGDGLSPYLKALKELRVFNYSSGSPADLNLLLAKKQFVVPEESNTAVVIESADMQIEEVKSSGQGMAPDHLLRLFAYNDIMRKVGADYFNKNFIRPELIAEAEKANIVSPVSSLIILETIKDYERFDIGESKNSLKNASMKSSGAVPEPHEWMLIILAAAIICYFAYKSSYLKTA